MTPKEIGLKEIKWIEGSVDMDSVDRAIDIALQEQAKKLEGYYINKIKKIKKELWDIIEIK